MVEHLNSPQPVFPVPSVEDVPDTEEDQPVAGIALVRGISRSFFPPLSLSSSFHKESYSLITVQDKLGPLNLPSIVFGAATFSSLYNAEEVFTSYTPLRATRLALR